MKFFFFEDLKKIIYGNNKSETDKTNNFRSRTRQIKESCEM